MIAPATRRVLLEDVARAALSECSSRMRARAITRAIVAQRSLGDWIGIFELEAGLLALIGHAGAPPLPVAPLPASARPEDHTKSEGRGRSRE